MEVLVVYVFDICALITSLSLQTIQLIQRHLYCPISAWIERSDVRLTGRDSDRIREKEGL